MREGHRVQISDAALHGLFRAVDLVGVFANALLGGANARRERLDPVGFASLAILSGVGGGLIRDTLLQRGPPIALTDEAYILTAMAGAALAFAVNIEGRLWDLAFPFVDAAALGCWAASGSEKTLVLGFGWLAAVLLGTITAVGGGMTRDVVLRRIPAVFGGNTLYASAALIASGVMVTLHHLGRPSLGLLAATATGASICLVARWRGWRLPQAEISTAHKEQR
jgi:uncharacterized membrane protein YeiH